MSKDAPPLAEPVSGKSEAQLPRVVAHETWSNPAPTIKAIQMKILARESFISVSPEMVVPAFSFASGNRTGGCGAKSH
jgi:hypothetical protein